MPNGGASRRIITSFLSSDCHATPGQRNEAAGDLPDIGRELLEVYLARMAEVRATGAATNETSYYGPLENLLNGVGQELRPRVIANGQIRNQGAGHPDYGLYAQSQIRDGEPAGGSGAIPERGVVEVKGLAQETWFTADTGQVSQYWQHYGLVLVSNYRSFLLIGRDANGQPHSAWRRLASLQAKSISGTCVTVRQTYLSSSAKPFRII